MASPEVGRLRRGRAKEDQLIGQFEWRPQKVVLKGRAA